MGFQMNYLNKLIIGFLILTTIHLYLPNITFAEAYITKHPPESISTPEKDIPGETTEVSGKKGWKWIVIALLAVAGGVAIAGSGGGDSSNNDSGSISVNW